MNQKGMKSFLPICFAIYVTIAINYMESCETDHVLGHTNLYYPVTPSRKNITSYHLFHIVPYFH